MGAGAVASDVALVWSNCTVFNAEGSAIGLMAAEAEAAFEAKWAREGLPPLASLSGRGANRDAAMGPAASGEQAETGARAPLL